MDSARLNIESGELNFCANHMPACAAVSGSSCEESLIASTASPILYSSADDRLPARQLCRLDIGAGSRTHVRPILIDVFDAGFAAVLLEGGGPAGRNFGGCRPERMFTLVIDQDDEGAALIVERIAHASYSDFDQGLNSVVAHDQAAAACPKPARASSCRWICADTSSCPAMAMLLPIRCAGPRRSSCQPARLRMRSIRTSTTQTIIVMPFDRPNFRTPINSS